MIALTRFMFLLSILCTVANSQVTPTKLLASDGVAEDEFGHAVSIGGDYALIGARYDDSLGDWGGSVYVYKRENAWVEYDVLTPSDLSGVSRFGSAVFISGNYAVVGAVGASHNGRRIGAAYVFRLEGNEWIEEAKLTPAEDYALTLGNSVSLSGNFAIVGDEQDFENGWYAGAAYIFKKQGENWIRYAKLLSPHGDIGGFFGFSVSISENYAAVSDLAGGPSSNSGSVYIFRFDDGSWVFDTELYAPDSQPGDHFGKTISLSGDNLLVGAPSDNQKGENTGSVYVFRRAGNNWIQEEKLVAPFPKDVVGFGTSVFLSGDSAIVGTYEAWNPNGGIGSAYTLFRQEGKWIYRSRLVPSDGSKWDKFGLSVSFSGETCLVSASFDDENGTESGAAYLYEGVFSAASVQADIDSTNSLVPAEGGTVLLNVSIANNTNASAELDYWTRVYDPEGNPLGKTLGPNQVNLLPFESYAVDETVYISNDATPGQYEAVSYVGTFPADTLDTDIAQFVKLLPAPVVVNPIPDQAVPENFTTYTVAVLDTVFLDIDSDTLSYSASSDGFTIASILESDNSLLLASMPEYAGESIVTVTATDEQSVSVSDTFSVFIEKSTGIHDLADSFPTRFALNQNYPNPFNPTTIITWQMPVSNEVVLTIYDVTGRKVKELVNKHVPAGRHNIVWDGTDAAGQRVASGIYLSQLVAGSDLAGSGQYYVDTRKMLLTR